MSDTIRLGELQDIPDPLREGVIQDVPFTQSNLNPSPIDTAVQDTVRNLGPIQNFSNAFQKSLISGTQADLAELLGDHERATEIALKAERDLPTTGGVSEFLGSTIGGVAPVIPAVFFPVLSIPVLAGFGLRAMGAGRGAVRAHEDISGEDVSAGKEAFVAAGYGLAVFATERIGLRNLRGVVDKLAPTALRRIAQAFSTGSSKATAKSILSEIAKVPGIAAVREAGQEGLEQALTNTIDMTYGAKSVEDLLQGVPTAAAMGAVGGGLVGGLGLAAQSRNIRKELSRTGVQRDLMNEFKDIDQDEAKNVGSIINAIADTRGITPKEALAEGDAITFRDETSLFSRTARKGSVGAFIVNSIPLFKRSVNNETFRELEDWLGVEPGKKWKVKQANKFRRELNNLLVGDDINPKAPVKGLEAYQLWLANTSAHTFETNIFEGARTSNVTFIDQVHGASEVMSNSPFEREHIARREKFNRDWKEIVIDALDTRAVFNRADAPNTGDAVTNLASIRDTIESKTLGTAQNISRLLQKNGFTGDELTKIRQQLPLILEDENVFNRLPRETQERLQPIVDIWGQFRDDALQAYQEEGALDQGFFDEMRDRLAEQKVKAGRKGDQVLYDKIDKQLEDLKGAQFVPIPYRLWFESIMANNPRKLHRVLSLLGTKKRKTLFIRDLVKNNVIKLEDIDFFQILGYYGRRLGKDVGLLKLKNAGIEEGLIKELPKGEHVDFRGGFVKAPKSAPILKGFQIRAPIADFISESTRYYDEYSIIDKGLAVVKMSQFINFLFLPTYDVWQATMLGSISPLHPIRTFKNVVKATNDLRTQSLVWQEAGINRARSTPYANPLENFNRFMQHIAENPNPAIRSLKGLLSTDAFRVAYNISWRTAWMLDGWVRQISYRHLTDDLGYSPKEAANITALYHADYAGVPAKTRRQLNRIFFTPTFKIAMGKLFTRMVKDSMSVSLKSGKIVANAITGKRGNVKFTKTEKLHAASLVRTISIIGAMDILITSFLGFERDQWGRRYIKKNVETKKGVKDVVFTLSAPFNMFLKYAFRAQESFGDPATTRPFVEFAKKNSWELHPVWRIAMGLANNEQTNGKPIAPTLADPEVRIARTMTYVLREASALVDEVLTNVSGQTDEAETRKILQDELGKLGEFVARMFVFSYLRTSGETKQARQIQGIERIMKEELNSIIDADGNIPPSLQEQIIDNALKRINDLVKQPTKK